MAGFFNTLHRMRGGSEQIPTFLSTHPDPLDRYQKVNSMATKEQVKDNKNSYRVNRDKYLRMIDGLVYGEDPKQGYVENNYFYHPEMKFQFPIPGSWKTVNTPAQLQIAPADGKAVILMNLAQGTSAATAMQSAISKDSIQVMSKKNISVNGLKAIEMMGNMQNNVRLLIYMIEYDGRVYQMSGLSEIANFSRYKSTFVNTFSKFKKLTDPTKLNKKAERIRIQTVKKDATLKVALQSYNMPANRLEELSILNGMELTDKVTKGMLIKTIGE
jgi:predicted Zn-dependent protease